MKKVYIALTIAMILGIFSACSDNNLMINDVHDKELENTTEGPVATPEQNSNKEIVTTESHEDLSATESEKEEPGDWSCEVNIRYNEEGALVVDYLIVSPNGKSTFEFTEEPLYDKIWYDMFTEAGGELCVFSDFNFDGYMDIRTQRYGAIVNQYYNIRIWNQEVGDFELNQDYMDLPNPVVNEEKKQIFTTNYDRGLGNYGLYEVKDGVLTKVAAIEAKISDDGSFEYIEIIGADKAKVVRSASDLDMIWKGYNVIIDR